MNSTVMKRVFHTFLCCIACFIIFFAIINIAVPIVLAFSRSLVKLGIISRVTDDEPGLIQLGFQFVVARLFASYLALDISIKLFKMAYERLVIIVFVSAFIFVIGYYLLFREAFYLFYYNGKCCLLYLG